MSQVPPKVSFELFCPRTTKEATALGETADKLLALNPEFFSVTYSPARKSQSETRATVLSLHGRGLRTAPHIVCIDRERTEILDVVQDYKTLGIDRIVVLRGDRSDNIESHQHDINHTSDVVELIRTTHGSHFHIDVAAHAERHPEAKTRQSDLDYLKRKVDAGADAAITQFFFEAQKYEDLINECSRNNIAIPIVPGVLTIHSWETVTKLSKQNNVEIPDRIRREMDKYRNDSASVHRLGLDIITELCEDLLRLAPPGLHFFTMNRPELSIEICKRLSTKPDPKR